MSNTFLTVQEIARRALLVLINNMVMAGLVYKDYAGDFKKKGDTIVIRKPATFSAEDFSSSISLQNITEGSTSLVLNHIGDVSVNFTSKERTLNVEDFVSQIAAPAMLAIAQKVDSDLHKEFYKAIPSFTGTSGTTPSQLDDIAGARKFLNNQKAPVSPRAAVWSPDAEAKFNVVPGIVNAEKSGALGALREGSIGKVFGFDNFMSQNVQVHTPGTFAANAVTTKISTLAVVDSYTLVIKSASGAATGTLVAGDILQVGNDQYTVTASATASGGTVSATVYPAVKSAYAVDTVVTFADAGKSGHVANLAFHPNACALVVRPLEPPRGGANSYTAQDPATGLSIRATEGYNMTTKTEILSFDILYGIKAIQPELAVRVLG